MGKKIRKRKKQERSDDPGGHALTRLRQFELERGLPKTPDEEAEEEAADEKTEGD